MLLSIPIDSRGTEMTDLSDLFSAQQTNVVNWHGSTIHGLFEFDELPAGLTLTFLAAKQSPAQGLQLRLQGGTLVANGKEGSDLVLWRDTAPSTVEIAIRPGGRAKSALKLWNVWRGGHGATQAWLGNAAMQIEGDPAAGRFCLRCSDGRGEPTFDDLVVEVAVSRMDLAERHERGEASAGRTNERPTRGR